MLVSTTEEIEGYQITQNMGIVMGNTVKAKFVGRDILAGLRNLLGGEVKEYTGMFSDARKEAIDRMIEEAERLGADGVVGARFASSQVTQMASEMLAYGTAVKIAKK